MVDYDSLKKYSKMKRERKKRKENEEEERAIEEEKDEEEEEEEDEADLENEEGLIEDAVLDKFKEDEESEDEGDWKDYLREMKKGRKRKKKMKFEKLSEQSEEESEEEEEEEEGGMFGNRARRRKPFRHSRMRYGKGMGMNHWQIQQMKRELKQSVEEKLKEEEEWKRLQKLSENDFITGKESQFKIALKNSMLSVNFLLIDFTFNLGRAIMDTFSLQNWDYSKTLLNKKIETDFGFKDKKNRNAFHYLAYFGNKLDVKTLESFVDKLLEKGISLTEKDCLQRKPIHYAALSGNLTFIHLVKEKDSQLQEKDILGNTLLSLYLQSYTISKEKLETFVNEYKNDINVIFKVSDDEYIKQVESFSDLAKDDKRVGSKLKKMLTSKAKALPWFESEMKFREGEQVPQVKESPFELSSTLIYAAEKKKDLVLTENLIQIGADVNLADQKGETILAKAIQSNDLNLIEILKKYKNLIDFSIGKIHLHF